MACINTPLQSLETQESKLKYWGGENYGVLKNYQREEKTNKMQRKCTLTLLEEFVLTLVWIHPGLIRIWLSDIFGMSKSTVSKVFITWVTFLFYELKIKQHIRNNLPVKFKTFPNTRVVTHCTAIFTEKPTLL